MSLQQTWGQQSSLNFKPHINFNHGKDLEERLFRYAKKRIREQGIEEPLTWKFQYGKGSNFYTVTARSKTGAMFLVRGIRMNAGGWPCADCGVGFIGHTPKTVQ